MVKYFKTYTVFNSKIIKQKIHFLRSQAHLKNFF